MSKRPWTPGPWKVYAIASENWGINDKWDNNRKLASKAPDMADLLIKWCENYYLSDPEQFDRDARQLLKEVGYDPEGK